LILRLFPKRGQRGDDDDDDGKPKPAVQITMGILAQILVGEGCAPSKKNTIDFGKQATATMIAAVSSSLSLSILLLAALLLVN
jgi:hypothetical protein